MVEKLLWHAMCLMEASGIELETDDTGLESVFVKESPSADNETDDESEFEEEASESTAASMRSDPSVMPVYLFDQCCQWLDSSSPMDCKLFMEKLPYICEIAASHSKQGRQGSKQLHGSNRRVRMRETRLDKAHRILWVRKVSKGGPIEVYSMCTWSRKTTTTSADLDRMLRSRH